MKFRKRFSCLIFLAASASVSLFGQTGDKIAPDLVFPASASSPRPGEAPPPPPTANVIVQTNSSVPGANLGLIQAYTRTVTSRELQQLVQDANVKYVSRDRSVGANLEYATPTVFGGSSLAAASSPWKGRGIGIAVIDSGVNPHDDLDDASCTVSRIVYQENFVPGEITTRDLYGHGTHVAGILAGNGVCSDRGLPRTRRFTGVAPQANIINLRVLDSRGSALDSTVIRAIDRAVRLRNTYNIRVINLSLGRGIFESYKNDPLCQAVERAWAAGIVVVVAAGNRGRENTAGNNGYGTIGSPGNDPFVITVGATNDMSSVGRHDDVMASYSSKGPTTIDWIAKPDLVAPGNSIIAPLVGASTTLARENAEDIIPLS